MGTEIIFQIVVPPVLVLLGIKRPLVGTEIIHRYLYMLQILLLGIKRPLVGTEIVQLRDLWLPVNHIRN